MPALVSTGYFGIYRGTDTVSVKPPSFGPEPQRANHKCTSEPHSTSHYCSHTFSLEYIYSQRQHLLTRELIITKHTNSKDITISTTQAQLSRQDSQPSKYRKVISTATQPNNRLYSNTKHKLTTMLAYKAYKTYKNKRDEKKVTSAEKHNNPSHFNGQQTTYPDNRVKFGQGAPAELQTGGLATRYND